MLEFIVRTYFDAPQNLELTIGLEVFCEDDFDPQKSAKVRRSAGRLRVKLGQYYQTEGRSDPIEIDIPKGHYAPVITLREPELKIPERSPGRLERKAPPVREIWACSATALVAILVFAAWRGRMQGIEATASPVRLTSEAGLASSPAVSRDGRVVVYACVRGSGGNLVLWKEDLQNRTKRRITAGQDDDYDPDISADGRTILFRSERDGGGIYKVASTGGPVQLLARYGRTPRFSPDGKWILYWEGEPYFEGASLYVLQAGGGVPRRLQARFQGARYGTWLPDSTHILFWGSDESGRDWWVTSIDDSAPVKTGAAAALRGLHVEYPMTIAGDRILFSAADGSSAGSATNLWSLPIDRGTWKISGKPRRVTRGAANELQASAAPGGAIVFSNQESRTNIWEMPLEHSGSAAGDEHRLTDYLAREHSPSVSRDRPYIAFSSDRSGTPDVWIRDNTSNNEFALKLGANAAFSPRISPDGIQVAYGVGTADSWPIFTRRLEIGSSQTMCADCGVPRAWSGDQQWLLYEAKQNEPFSVGVLNVSTGEHAIIASAAFPTYPDTFSPDGKWFSFHARNTNRSRVLYVAPFHGLYEVPQQA